MEKCIISILVPSLIIGCSIVPLQEGKAGRTPLHMAVERNDGQLMGFLLNECQNINIEVMTYGGLTPYQVAAILGRDSMLLMLEEHGADPLMTPESDYDSSDDESEIDIDSDVR